MSPFQMVAERDAEEDVAERPERSGEKFAMDIMMVALSSLSKKALVAASTMFTGAALFSAWWLWNSILPNPSVTQLTGVGMYAVFILCLEYVRRR